MCTLPIYFFECEIQSRMRVRVRVQGRRVY